MREWTKVEREESEERERENGKVIEKREREREGNGRKNFFIFLVLTFSSFPQTPLHWVASKGSVECVNTLIKHGADVAAKAVRKGGVCENASHRRRDVWGFV